MQVQRQSVPDQVRRTLTERILAGQYQPGERLVELQIARELGVSQGSVREALRELEAARLVESEPHRGTRVRVVTLQEVRETYYVRGVLEQAAAPAAVKAFEGDVSRLKCESDAVVRASRAGERSEQAARVYAFHHMIMEAAGNSVLLRLWESLALETQVRVNLAWRAEGCSPDDIAASYTTILDAFAKGHGKLAGRLLRRHADFFSPAADAGE